jgi:hypothetical protein
MSLNPTLEITIETDDRTVLFPAGKFISMIQVKNVGDEIHLEATYVFNEERYDPLIATMTKDDGFRLARAIMDAVFQGRTQHVVTRGERLGVIFQPNGFILVFSRYDEANELFIASPAVIRLAHSILRALDRVERQRNN